MCIIHPSELVGNKFLIQEQDDSQRFRAKIVEAIDKFVDDVNANPDPKHSQIQINNDDQFEDILTYQQIMDYLDEDGNDPLYWKFQSIEAHEGPLHQHHPSYKGSTYNLLIA
jgi:hypothetical protein